MGSSSLLTAKIKSFSCRSAICSGQPCYIILKSKCSTRRRRRRKIMSRGWSLSMIFWIFSPHWVVKSSKKMRVCRAVFEIQQIFQKIYKAKIKWFLKVKMNSWRRKSIFRVWGVFLILHVSAKNWPYRRSIRNFLKL